PRERRALAVRACREIEQLLHELMAVHEVAAADHGQLDRARRAAAQRYAERLLELLDTRGDDRLGVAHLARGVGEAPRLRDPHEGFYAQNEIHGLPPQAGTGQ